MATLDEIYKNKAKSGYAGSTEALDYNQMLNQINQNMAAVQNQLNAYSNPNSSGYWEAVDDNKWKYTDRYGNVTYNTGDASNNWNGIGANWNADTGRWESNTDLVDVNQAKNDLNNTYNNLLMQQLMVGNMAGQQNFYDNMASQMEEMYAGQQEALEQQLAAQQAATQQRIDANVQQINQLRPTYQQQAADAAQQAYINKMLAGKTLNEKLAANGLNGTGVSESAAIQNENTYSNSVNEALIARDNALRGLDNQIANVRAGGDVTLSELESAYASNLANLLNAQANAQWGMAQEAQNTQNALLQNYIAMLDAQNKQNIAQNQWQQEFDYAAQQAELDRQNALAAAAAKAYTSGANNYSYSDIDKIYKAAKENGQPMSDAHIEAYKNLYGFEPVLYDEANVDAGVNQLKSAINHGKNNGVIWNDQMKADYLKALNNYEYGLNLSQNDMLEILSRLG